MKNVFPIRPVYKISRVDENKASFAWHVLMLYIPDFRMSKYFSREFVRLG